MVPSLDDLFEVTGAAYKGIFNSNNFRFRKLKEHSFLEQWFGVSAKL